MGETLHEAMRRVKGSITLKAFCDAQLEARPRDGRDHYVCPKCGSGNNRGAGRGTTAFHLYGTDAGRFKCQACNVEGDIFDLAGILEGTEDSAEQCNAVAAFAGVEGWANGGAYDWDGKPMMLMKATTKPPTANDGAGTHEAERKPRETSRDGENDHVKGRDRHREYIRQAQSRIEHPDALAYLSSRGIDLDTARAWGLGYDPNAGGAKDANGKWCRRGRIVIPWAGTDYYHIDRSIAPDVAEAKYHKPKGDEVGEQPLWNPAALRAPSFFVVEGALDALAVQSCGFEAVALGSTGDKDLQKAMEAHSDVGIAILMLDNDEAGRREQGRLAAELAERGLPFFEVDTEEMGLKDPFETYAEYRLDLHPLRLWLGQQRDKGIAERERLRREANAKVMTNMGLYDPATVTEGLFTMEEVLAPIPTGLARIDNAIGGGLPAQGLVTLGAVSSVGKTSLVHQICDNVAATGRPVLFCSVEQGRNEIVAKSLSRIMGAMARGNGARVVASAQAILNKDERERWNASDVEKVTAFTKACETYYQRTHREDGTPTLYIMEPSLPPTVTDIRKAAEAIRRMNGQAPIVAVDYIQLLAAPVGLERGSDKQIIDANTLGLRQLARDMPTCVIAISSLNRASYAGSIDLNSFKESGMLEYSSDLLLGMQPYGLQDAMRGKSEDSGQARAKARQIMRDYKEAAQKQVELVVLKNRNGGIGESPCLTFDGITSTFTEATPPGMGKARPARL